MMGQMQEFLSLPSQIHIALAAGFLAYLAAFAGVRARHNQTEIILFTVLFSAAATFLLPFTLDFWKDAFPTLTQESVLTALSGGTTILLLGAVGLLWSRWFRRVFFRCLRMLQLAQHDGSGSVRVLDSIIHDPGIGWNQISVTLLDGSTYTCDDCRPFQDSPIGIARIDTEGNVAFVATEATNAQNESTVFDHARSQDWGDQVTYFPATQIRSLTIRMQRR